LPEESLQIAMFAELENYGWRVVYDGQYLGDRDVIDCRQAAGLGQEIISMTIRYIIRCLAGTNVGGRPLYD